MKQKILIVCLSLITLYFAANLYASKQLIGSGVEGLFKIGTCFMDDEFGVTYKTTGTTKGRTVAEVIRSEKYPSRDNYKVGHVELFPPNENPRKLYPISCP